MALVPERQEQLVLNSSERIGGLHANKMMLD